MQRKTKLLIAGASAVGLVALALGGFAVAHSRHEGMGYGMMDGHGRGHGMMGMAETFANRYDTNKDGNITQEEINALKTKEEAEALLAKPEPEPEEDEHGRTVKRASHRQAFQEGRHPRDGDQSQRAILTTNSEGAGAVSIPLAWRASLAILPALPGLPGPVLQRSGVG